MNISFAWTTLDGHYEVGQASGDYFAGYEYDALGRGDSWESAFADADRREGK